MPVLWVMAAVFLSLLATMPVGEPAFGQPPDDRQPVVISIVRSAEFADRVEALGTTLANETVRITANVTEKIAELRFDDGQSVEAGDVLAVLDKSEEEADLRGARALLGEKRLAYQRARELERQRYAATAQLDLRRAEVQEYQARIAAIEARVEDRVIRAPFAGVVGLRNISVGTLVEPGDVIITLDHISVIKVDFSVPSPFLPTLRPGMSVIAKATAFGDREFRGTIRGIDSRVDPVTRSVVARAILPNADGVLKPGLLMTIELLKNPRTALVVPEEALIPRGRRNSVLVVDEAADNTVEQREVSIGARAPGRVEIVSGLAAGEMVVTRGVLQVRPGQKVTIMAVDDGEQTLSQLLRQPAPAKP